MLDRFDEGRIAAFKSNSGYLSDAKNKLNELMGALNRMLQEGENNMGNYIAKALAISNYGGGGNGADAESKIFSSQFKLGQKCNREAKSFFEVSERRRASLDEDEITFDESTNEMATIN